MKKSLLLNAILWLTTAASAVNGPWNGTLEFGGQKLGIVFNIVTNEKGEQVVTMDSPNQGVKDVPAELVKNTADTLEITVNAIGAKFSGVVKDNVINGTFSQSGIEIPLKLERGVSVYNRPQTPQPPFEYKTEEITFENVKENAVLSGTLTYPTGYNPKKRKNTPVVLLVTGSGQQNRDEELFEHKPFAVIADYLAKHGIASLRYDDRGVWKSTGSLEGLTTENSAADALAGIEYLKNSKKFGKIGVLGHSEGGMIAFMAASQKAANFIVSMAGPGVRGDKILVQQNKTALTQYGLPDSTINECAKALQFIFDAKIAAHKNGSGLNIPMIIATLSQSNIPNELKQSFINLGKQNNPWMNWYLATDPTLYIQNTTCPVMAVNGSKDLQVPSKQNLDAIQANLPNGKKHLIKEYEGLNHLFQHCTTGAVTEYIDIEETISEEVLQDIANWINGL